MLPRCKGVEINTKMMYINPFDGINDQYCTVDQSNRGRRLVYEIDMPCRGKQWSDSFTINRALIHERAL